MTTLTPQPSPEMIEAAAKIIHYEMGCTITAARICATRALTAAMAAPTREQISFIERSKVREILLGVADEHVHISEVLLRDVDKLPIMTREIG